jgi:hypothetical protein
MLIGALVLAGAGGWLAAGLDIRSSFEELLPSDLPSVAEIRELVRRVGGDGTVLVQVEALAGPDQLPAAEALAVRLASEYQALGPSVIRSVEVSLRPVERWYADHWPLFASLADLTQARDQLRAAIARGKSQVLSLGIGDEPPLSLPPLLDPAHPSPRQEIAARFARYPGGFMAAPDGRSVTILVRPAGTSLGVAESRALLDRLSAITHRHQRALDEGRLRVGLAGTFPILVAQYDAILRDIASTFLLVLAVVMLSLLAFYRSIRPVAVLGLAILVAVALTFGLARLAIGFLNTQTAFLGAIVVGNGINYGLIYLARLAQLRRSGQALEPAVRESAQVAWRATLLASLATCLAFGTLVIATNRGFRHFGLIGGLGMVLCWLSTFALLPSLLVLAERIWPARSDASAPPARPAPRWLARAFHHPGRLVLGFGILAAASAALFLVRLPDAMERNLDRLSTDVRHDPELARDQARANASLGRSEAGVIALLPTPEMAEGYCQAVRGRAAQPRWKPLIEGCETLSSVVPDHQPEKLALISELLARLGPAVIDPLPPATAARVRAIRADLAAQHTLGVKDAPPALIDRFRERDGTVGRIAFVRARSDAQLELGPNLQEFVAGVRDVPVGGARYDAAGETVVVADLLADVQRQGPISTILSFLCVCSLVLLFLRRQLRPAVQVLLSLAAGVVLLAGVAAATGLRINFFNFIVYPITFGIAVDYGANVAVRADERRDVLAGLAEVGPAVALCSWTTIVGYGSLLLAANRALRSFGWYAVAGELTTLATALVLLPALALLRPAGLLHSRLEETHHAR